MTHGFPLVVVWVNFSPPEIFDTETNLAWGSHAATFISADVVDHLVLEHAVRSTRFSPSQQRRIKRA